MNDGRRKGDEQTRGARWRARATDALACVLLAALVARLGHGIARVRDLPWDDEASYESTGIHLLAALRAHAPMRWPTADWAPLYDAYYGLLDVVCPDPIRLFDVSWLSLVAAVTFALYGLARRLSQPPALALSIAAVPLLTNLFHVQPYPSLFGLALVLAGTTLALGLAASWAQPVIVLGAFAFASFARPELAVGVCAGAAWLAVRAFLAWRGGEALVARAGAFGAGIAVVSLVPALFLLVTLGNPLGGGRSYDAFAQHYAFVTTRAEHLAGNPWMSSAGIVHRDFGDATRLSEAARANPGALARHVSRTLAELPGNVLDACALRREIGTQASVPWLAASAVIVVVCVLALVVALRRVRSQDPRRRLVVFTLALAVISAAPGAILVFPRAHYVMPICVLAWLVVSTWACDRLVALRALVTRRGPVWTLAVAAALVLFVPSPASSAPVPMPVRHGVLALRAMKLGDAAVYEAGFGFTALAGYDVPVDFGWGKDAPLFALLDRDRAGAIVLADRFLARDAFASDPDVAELIARPWRAGFCLTYEDPGEVRLYARPADLGDTGQRSACELAIAARASGR